MNIVKTFNSTLTLKRKIALVILLIVIPFVVLEIWSLNRLATYGNEINKLEGTKQNLMLQNQILEAQISKQAALKEVELKAKLLGFEKITKVEIVKSVDLALNQ